MKAKVDKEKNSILILNFERKPEEAVFKKIVQSLKNSSSVKITRTIMGPSEDIVKAKYGEDDIFLCYDIDYGICPIRCEGDSLNDVYKIIEKVLESDETYEA
ncbi:MAG: hypothetical protein RR957_05010 [Oscillospiraceae bacterium]